MTDDVVLGLTALALVLWGALFFYQYLWAMARLRHAPEGPHAQLILFRHAISLLLLLMLGSGAFLAWREADPAAAGRLAVAARPAIGLLALWGWWRQFRQWPPILGLEVAGTRTIPLGYWLVVAIAAGVMVLRYGPPTWPTEAWTGTLDRIRMVAVEPVARWAGAALLGAGLLVLGLRADERLRWLTGNVRWHHPRLARATAWLFLSAIVALGSLAAALPAFPPIRFDVALLALPAVTVVVAVLAIRHPLYDIFVSYKSEDVGVVRQVADLLIASGVRVWFAEYQILLRRGRFEAALERGLRRSRWGLAFTNNRYIESAWCRREIEVLLRRRPGRVLEVQLPREEQPRLRYPALSRATALESRDVAEILEFVGTHTGLPAGAREPAPDGGRDQWEGRYSGRPLALDITGWELHQSPIEGEIGGLTFRHLGPRRLLVNLWAHPETSDAGRRQEQSIDDRRMFDFLVNFARGHLRRLPVAGVRATGVHLFFHSALSQIAMTYRVRHYWTRKVSVVIPNPSSGQVAEFEFTFGFFGPFTEYLRHAALMDRLAQSLRWS